MTPKQYQRAKEIFYVACALDSRERAAYVDTQCDDTVVRRAVHRLFATEKSDPRLLEIGVVRDVVERVVSETAPLPPRVGEYRIIRRLGVGGMGIVYEAEQHEPRRRVALKVIAPGVTGPSLLDRFRHEAEVLGRLHHPGIAAIYEAGTTDLGAGGQPFFAMELIEGPSLIEYADERNLSVTDRLELMAAICDAVHHAHQKGVIHRDLKPSNILVEPGAGPDEVGQPKILDFGIARATDGDLRRVTLHTDQGQLLGTVPYMSPEQVSADRTALDTRSDVWALGVILFELLTGELPHDLDGLLIHEAVRVICEEEPYRVGVVNRTHRGDVDTIVARALEREPARRYESAAQLAADIRRSLADEPILARPPTTMYQLRKFARRNRALVGGVAGVALALVLGVAGMTVFSLRASHNEHLANQRAEVARWLAYRSALTGAAAALDDHDVASARAQLERAPTEHRRWTWAHLNSRLDQSLAVIDDIGDAETFVAFDVDGPRLIVAGRDLWVRDATAGDLIAGRAGVGTERYVGLSPDGSTAVVVTGPESIETRDVASGGTINTFVVPQATATRRAHVSQEGTRLALRQGRYSVSVIDSSGSIVTTITDRRQVAHVAVSPDDVHLVTAEEDGSNATIWNMQDGERVRTLTGHTDELRGVSYSPDGRFLATASRDATVRLWEAATGRALKVFEGHREQVNTVTFSNSGATVASAGRDRTIRVWSVDTGRELTVFHGAQGVITDLVFSADDTRLASIDESSQIRVWDVSRTDDTEVLRGHHSYVYSVAFSPDGSMIASTGWDGYAGAHDAVRLWDTASGVAITSWGRGERGHRLWFDPTGTKLAVWRFGSTIAIWDTRTGETIGERPVSLEHFAEIDTARDRVHRIGDIWQEPTAPKTQGDTWSGVVASPDGTLLFRDGGLWETKRGVRRFHLGGQWLARFSHDSTRIAIAHADHTITIFDTHTGQLLGRLTGHTDEVMTLAFTPDDTRIATSGRDRSVRIWNAATFEEVVSLRGHSSYVKALAFHPDGSMLVTASGDHTLRVWDTVPRRERLRAQRERARLVQELAPIVAAWFEELGSAAGVTIRVEAQVGWSNRRREVVRQMVLAETVSRRRRETTQ